jgi:predicted KAP-like P-loop ATPase
MQTLSTLTFEGRDDFQRKTIAEKVIALLVSDIPVSPMVINGGWGTGKTEFCHKLINLLKESCPECKTVYIDAFAADHADEPLMTLLAAVLNVIPKSEQLNLIQKAIPAVKFGIKTTLKAGVSWILKQDAADITDGFEEDLKEASDDLISIAVERALKEHMHAEENILTLKTALQEAAKNHPIFIFVDELDRCRPDFAMGMLESIKHVFSVSGLNIILVANNSQLVSSVQHCYGIDEHCARKYLDKFIGYNFTLPQTAKSQSNEMRAASRLHFKNLVLGSDFFDGTFLRINDVLNFIETLIEVNQLSLREVETLIKHFQIYHILSEKKGLSKDLIFGCQLLRSLGIYLFCFHPEVILNKDPREINIEVILKKTGIFYIPAIQEYYDPTEAQLISVALILENKIFVKEMDALGSEKYAEWKAMAGRIFHSLSLRNINTYIIDAGRLLRLENN